METPPHIPIHDPFDNTSRALGSGVSVGEEACDDVLLYGWTKVDCVAVVSSSELRGGATGLGGDVVVSSSVLGFGGIFVDAEGSSGLHAIVRTMRV